MELNNTELQTNYEEMDSKINRLMTVFLDLKTIIKEQKLNINSNMEVSTKSNLKIQQNEENIELNTNNIDTNNNNILNNNDNINTNQNKLELLEGFKNNVLEKLEVVFNLINNNSTEMNNVRELAEVNQKMSEDINNYNNKINEINESINNINQKSDIVKNGTDVANNNINLIREHFNTHVEEYSSNIKSVNDYIQISQEALKLLDELSKTNQSKLNQSQDKIKNNITGLVKVKQTINEIKNNNLDFNSRLNDITRVNNSTINKLDNQSTINGKVNSMFNNISSNIEANNSKINQINQSINNINQKSDIVKNGTDEANNNINLIREHFNTHVEEYSSNIKSVNDYIQISQEALKLLDELSKTNQSKLNQSQDKIKNNITGLSKVKQTINEINNNIGKYTSDFENIQSKINQITGSCNNTNTKLENLEIINAKMNSMFNSVNNIIEGNSNLISENLEKCTKNTNKINNMETNINEKLITHVEEYNNNMVNIQKITDGNKEVFSLIDSKINELDDIIKTNTSNVSNNTNFIKGFDDIIKDKINSVNDKILVEKKLTQRLFNNIDFPDKLHQKTLIDFRISEGKNNFITYHNLDDIMKQSEIKNYLIINKTLPNDISLIDFSIEDNHSSITSGSISNEVHMSNEYLMFVVIPPEMKLDEDVSKIKIIIKNYNLDKEINKKQFDCMKFQYTDKRNIFVFKFKTNMMYQGYYQHCIISLVVNGYTLFEFPRNVYNYDTTPYQPTIHGNKYHYHIRPGKITKNVDITLPELEVDDTFVFKNKLQTLHNKKLIFLADEKVSIRKKDLARITSIIKKLKPMEYYKNKNNLIKHTDVSDERLKNEYNFEAGLLAQHIKTIKSLKHLVSEDPSTGLLSLDYYGFIPYLIQAMKEIISVNESYEKRIKTLENDTKVNKSNIEKIIKFNNNM